MNQFSKSRVYICYEIRTRGPWVLDGRRESEWHDNVRKTEDKKNEHSIDADHQFVLTTTFISFWLEAPYSIDLGAAASPRPLSSSVKKANTLMARGIPVPVDSPELPVTV
jgi:hypothetical protein